MITARTRFLKGLLAALFMLAILCGVGAVLAEEGITSTIEASGTDLTGPGSINVSIRVTNNSDVDFSEPITLYDPHGEVVKSFGDNGSLYLKSQEYRSWSGLYDVTEADLNEGRVSYTIHYNVVDETGLVFDATQELPIDLTYSGEQVRLSVTRTITPEVCRSGKMVSVTYTLVNSGNVELSRIRVTESLNNRTQTVDHLSPGGSSTVTFSATIGSKDLESGATINYNASGESKTLQQTVDKAVIPVAKPDLKMVLEAVTPNVNIGDPAVLRLTFENKGNVSYSNVTVRDNNKGEIMTGLEIPAGQTVYFDKEFILTEPTSFTFKAVLNDNTGETREMTSASVPVQVYDPQNTLILTLDLRCDQDTVSEDPAVVRFTLNVTNNANTTAKNIAIRHGTVNIATISELPAGETIRLDRDVQVSLLKMSSRSGQFRFSASAKDALGNEMTFQSNTVQISYIAPTAMPTDVPVPTVQPLATLAPASEKDIDPLVRSGRDLSRLLAGVAVVLLALAVALLVIAAIVRGQKKRHSENAYDHLELARRRDYGIDPEEEEAEEDDGEDESVPVRRNDRDEELAYQNPTKADKTNRAMSEDPLEMDAPEPEVTEEDVRRVGEDDRKRAAYAEDGYHIRRSDARPENDAEAAQAAVRRRRNVRDGE